MSLAWARGAVSSHTSSTSRATSKVTGVMEKSSPSARAVFNSSSTIDSSDRPDVSIAVT